MAEQKIDPNRPKDDGTHFATSHFPTAEAPVSDLPLGEATLEAQREGFKKAEQQQVQGFTENPLDVAGVDADVQNASVAPEQSGPAGTTKDAVKEQGAATEEAVKQQNEEVKQELAEQQQQQEAPKTTTEEPKETQGNAVHLTSGATTAQPRDEGSLPVKQDNPEQVAKEESANVEAGDPQQQHADEAKGETPKAVVRRRKK
jgi:hypothetical protein